MKIKWTILIIASLMILTGCANGPDKEIIIEDVVRIFYHEEDKYTFMIQKEDQEIISSTVYFRFDSGGGRLRIIADVEPQQKMWAKYTSYIDWNAGEVMKNAEIHIHSFQDIDGGGWNHGKFGSGTTSVLK